MTLHFLDRLRGEAAGVYRIVRAYPSTLVWPLLLLGLVLGLGIWGVKHVSHVEENSNKDQANSLALSAAVFLSQQLAAAISPLHLMAAMVVHDPRYIAVSSLFKGLAPSLLAQAPPNLTQVIQYLPYGTVRDMYPVEGNEAAEGLNIFEKPEERAAAVQMVRQNMTVLSGPYQLVQGGVALIARVPIFVPGVDANETFGIPGDLSPQCGAPCAYNASTRTKFWGAATAVIKETALRELCASILAGVERLGFRYEIRGVGFTEQIVIAASSVSPSNPVLVTLPVADKTFEVLVAPEKGWRSNVYRGLLAGVIVLGIALATLMFAALVSRKRHQMLLEALLPKELLRDLHGTDTTLLDARILEAETTADMMLDLLNRLLEGYMPDLRDVVFIRQAIIRGVDLYQPTDLNKHICNANLDKDVARNLMQQLGHETGRSSAFSALSRDAQLDDECFSSATRSFAAVVAGAGAGQYQLQQQQQGYATLSGALALILAPQPTSLRDTRESLSGGENTATAAIVDTATATVLATTAGQTLTLMPRDIDAATGSPRPSNANFVSRAITLLREGGGGGGAAAKNGAVIMTSMEIVVEQAQQQQGGVGPPLSAPAPVVDSAVMEADALAPLRPRPVVSMVDIPASALADDGIEDADPQPPRLSPPNAAAVAAAAAAAAAGTLDDSTMPRSIVRRPPRRVASALGPGAFAAANNKRRRSLLLSLTNGPGGGGPVNGGGVVSGAGMLAAAGASAAAPPPPPGASVMLPSGSRRVSVASILDGVLPTAAPEGSATPSGDPAGGSNRSVLSTYGQSRRSLATAGVGRGGKLPQSLPPALPPPPPPVIEEVERVLAQADSWQFDTWRLRDVTNGHPLSALGFYLFHRAGLIERLRLKPSILARLLRHIESGYPDNPYHNATHAADVLQTLHVIVHGAQLHVHYVDQLGLMAAYWAAIVHDYGHPGLTNDFLVATSDPLAVRYNDRSPLENHHAAASFGLLQRPGLDLLAPFSKSEKAAFRKQVIDMVLATDVKQHFTLLSQFNTAHRLASFAHSPSTAKGIPTTRLSGNVHLDLNDVVDPGADCKHLAPKPLDDTERLLSLQLAIKAADLGHLGEELEVHQRWLAGLEEEFFRQGDRERSLGLPISPLFDRAKQGVSKSQVGFYDFVALPLVHALCGAFPGTQPLMTCFLGNYHYWKTVEGQATSATPPQPHGAQRKASLSMHPEASSPQLPDLERGK